MTLLHPSPGSISPLTQSNMSLLPLLSLKHPVLCVSVMRPDLALDPSRGGWAETALHHTAVIRRIWTQLHPGLRHNCL